MARGHRFDSCAHVCKLLQPGRIPTLLLQVRLATSILSRVKAVKDRVSPSHTSIGTGSQRSVRERSIELSSNQ